MGKMDILESNMLNTIHLVMVIAYCSHLLIKKIHNTYWITGGLLGVYRGKGMGTILFKKILQEIPSSVVWLEVLESNSVARKVYVKLGFKKVKEKNVQGRKVIVMKTTRVN